MTDMQTDTMTMKEIINAIRSVQDTIITNIIMVGETPAPTFQEKARVRTVMNRLAMAQIDDCSTDAFQNPVGIIRGTAADKPPMMVIAHLDSFLDEMMDVTYTVKKNSIVGPGVSDNSAGVGILISLPAVLKSLGVQFQSDLVLVGVKESIGRGNLGGIRHLMKNWSTPIRGALCLEAVELGRLNYFSEGMIRAEITCIRSQSRDAERKTDVNAILVINDIINQILALRLPKRPRSKIVIGRIAGGYNHGKKAETASIGFEIHSDADEIVREVFDDVIDIVDSFKQIYDIQLELETISNLNAARLAYNHPLVKSASGVLQSLGIEPAVRSTESELSILLSNNVPALTLGMTHSVKTGQIPAVKIEPMFSGIAQLVGVLKAIDQGVCDEQKLA